MKSSIKVRIGLAIATFCMTGAVFAQGPGSMGGPGSQGMGHRPPFERAFGGHGVEGRWWNNPKIVERLKLSDDQRKAFDQILLEHREKLIDLRANLEKTELTMESLVGNEQPNEGAILGQIDKVAAARAELEKANARYLLALRSKLTPEQWKQVQEFRHGDGREGWGQEGHRPDRMGPGRRGPGGPDGPPPAPPAGPQGMLGDEGGPQPQSDAGAPGAQQ
ncbi:MAG TPA: Spy/CpxP family protein refolding chaperone [Terracidiphilus sp.]|jgi:Spy/CpxP family protein refolding chaperone|nr:Spy/CpxP family protein refolding chaperone [Terracidiphilus sp.]